MSIMIFIFLALSLVPANVTGIAIDLGGEGPITLELQADGRWLTYDDEKPYLFYVKGCTLTMMTEGHEETTDFSEWLSISDETDWETLSELCMEGEPCLSISREENGVLLTFEASEAEGGTVRITWTAFGEETTPPSGEESASGGSLLTRLIETQKEQRALLKKLFMTGETLEEFTLHLYPEKSELYERLDGGARWDRESRTLHLFAGEEEDKLRFTMAHELAHLITYDLVERLGYADGTGYPAKVPVWYLEGLAEFGAIRWANAADQTYYFNEDKALHNFKAEVANGASPAEVLDRAMARTGKRIHGQEYAAVGTFVEQLYERHGGGKTLVSILVDSADDGKMVEAIERHAGASLETLKQEWIAFLADWYEFKTPDRDE